MVNSVCLKSKHKKSTSSIQNRLIESLTLYANELEAYFDQVQTCQMGVTVPH